MNKLTQSELRMQMLAGVITEGEYTSIINKETEEEEKSSLNESMIGGIVGVGAINQIPATPKTDYEMAFEHFLGERYQVKPNRERDDIEDVNEEEDLEEEKLDESVLTIAGGVVAGILGIATLLGIIKSVFTGIGIHVKAPPVILKAAVEKIGTRAMQEGKNPIQVAIWMAKVNSMIDTGEVKRGKDLVRTWGDVSKIDTENVFGSSESKEGNEEENED